jgi:hypothetical protein
MFKFILVSLLGFGVMAHAAKGPSVEVICGQVVGIDQKETRVSLHPVDGNGKVSSQVISQRVLPDSLNVAKVAKGKKNFRFCVQLPLVEGAHYKAWTTILESGKLVSKTASAESSQN